MVKNSSKAAIFVRVGLDLKKPFFVLLKIIMLHLSGSTEEVLSSKCSVGCDTINLRCLCVLRTLLFNDQFEAKILCFHRPLFANKHARGTWHGF